MNHLATVALALEHSTANAIFGAGLGAAFYILLKTHKYLVKRTFDPRYNNTYLTRFVTGVVAGFILSTVIDFALRNEGPQSDAKLISLVPGVVAILGGFSAEAVEQILRRMVDILVTAVRGDGAEHAKAQAKLEKAELGLQHDESILVVREKLDGLEKFAGSPKEFAAAIEELRLELKRSRLDLGS